MKLDHQINIKVGGRGRVEDWGAKALHGQFERWADDLSSESLRWITTESYKKEGRPSLQLRIRC